MAKRSEAKSAKRSFASKIKKKTRYFDTKLSFALLASLRSDIFCEFLVDSLLVVLPEGVNCFTVSYLLNKGKEVKNRGERSTVILGVGSVLRERLVQQLLR